MKYKNQKKIFFASASLPLIFILLGILAIFIYCQEIKNEDYIKTTATISDIECHTEKINHKSTNVCSTSVNYEINNEKYENVDLGYTIPFSFKGMKTIVYYNKNHPYMLKPMGTLFIGIGAILFGIFFIILEYKTFYLPAKKQEKQSKNLLENGKQIYVTVTKIKPDKSYSSNGKNPYYAACTYIDENGKKYYLKTESTFADLETWFKNQGDTDVLIKAYIDKNNPKIYHVPVENLFKNRR